MNIIDVHMSIEEPKPLTMDMEGSGGGYQTNNYENLTNLPKLNGIVIKGNMEEIDPTVPDWAKNDAPSELSFSDIKEIWDDIFKEG